MSSAHERISQHSAADVASLAARFGSLLRTASIPVGPERAVRFAEALSVTGPSTMSELYWVARVVFVSDASQIPAFERVFAKVFGSGCDPAEWRGQERSATALGAPRSGRARRQHDPTPPEVLATRHAGASLATPGGGGEGAGVEDDTVLAYASIEKRLRHKDFGEMTLEEIDLLRDLAHRLSLAVPERLTRRRVRARRGRDLDVRATLRSAQRSGGDPTPLVRRRRSRRPRRLVVLCDISGSMETYARAYLQLLWSATAAARAEVFVFATELTRLTDALAAGVPVSALARAGAVAPDWSGGTRIGEALGRFNRRYGAPGLARGAVVVVLSDGWEPADPSLLGHEMGRLRRLAHRVVWVNPRVAAEGFAPLAGGMAAALPHLDALVSGHSLDAFDAVLDAIAGEGARPAQRSGRR